MFSDLRVDPTEFKRCVGVLSRKLDEVALRAGVPDSEWTDLESTLASLPPFSRDRVAVMLQGIHVQAQNEFPAMAFAANYVLRLAHEVWGEPTHSPAPLFEPRASRCEPC
jgi:hypothetical protein